MDDSLKDSWQPQGPVSKQIKERIQKYLQFIFKIQK